MKKVFLLFGIAAFSSASAQQNDLFDIQKHLQKKKAEDKKAIKKKLMVLPFNKPIAYHNSYLGIKPGDYYTLPNGDAVVNLSLDNMPCVVPDMRQFQIMPNMVYSKPFNFFPHRPKPGQIPNGSEHYRMIVSK